MRHDPVLSDLARELHWQAETSAYEECEEARLAAGLEKDAPGEDIYDGRVRHTLHGISNAGTRLPFHSLMADYF